MSLVVQDITNKWHLAERMSGHSGAPEEALRCIFTGVMQRLEEITKIKFEAPMKDRVWDKVSGDRLRTIKETYILEFCDNILGSFNNDEAAAMLKEHRSTGAVQTMQYVVPLQTAYQMSKSSIIDAIVQKAKSMTDTWTPEIVDAIKSEGIELPRL